MRIHSIGTPVYANLYLYITALLNTGIIHGMMSCSMRSKSWEQVKEQQIHISQLTLILESAEFSLTKGNSWTIAVTAVPMYVSVFPEWFREKLLLKLVWAKRVTYSPRYKIVTLEQNCTLYSCLASYTLHLWYKIKFYNKNWVIINPAEHQNPLQNFTNS